MTWASSFFPSFGGSVLPVVYQLVSRFRVSRPKEGDRDSRSRWLSQLRRFDRAIGFASCFSSSFFATTLSTCTSKDAPTESCRRKGRRV